MRRPAMDNPDLGRMNLSHQHLVAMLQEREGRW